MGARGNLRTTCVEYDVTSRLATSFPSRPDSVAFTSAVSNRACVSASVGLGAPNPPTRTDMAGVGGWWECCGECLTFLVTHGGTGGFERVWILAGPHETEQRYHTIQHIQTHWERVMSHGYGGDHAHVDGRGLLQSQKDSPPHRHWEGRPRVRTLWQTV